jgi:hypothetical protein
MFAEVSVTIAAEVGFAGLLNELAAVLVKEDSD